MSSGLTMKPMASASEDDMSAMNEDLVRSFFEGSGVR
jgi:hypothetical protein